MKKRIFFTIAFVFVFALCSIHRAYVPFSIAKRGIWDEVVKDMSFFYGYITLTWATLGWYFISGLMIWFAVQRLKKLQGGWTKWIITTGLIALFLAPGIFVDLDQAPAVVDLLSAANFDTPSPVFPAWASILRYLIEAPNLLYRLFAIWITFWTIPLTWLIVLGLSLSTKVTRNFLWS
jgi:hypothetical protein